MIFFNLTNILITFYSYIKKFLAKKLNIFIIIYLNNTFIYIINKKKSIFKLYIIFLNS